MNFQNLLYSAKDSIAHITINRPDKLNALNYQTMTDIMEAFMMVSADPQVKAAIITGSGEKSFIAGADISEIAELNPLSGKKFSQRGQEIFNFIESLNKPVIAAVNGFALGGGCELAMACHMRIASENAKFGQPEVTLGIIPGYGGTQRLPRLVGKGRALELILSGGMIDAQEACRIGLVNKIVPYAGMKEIEKDGVKKQVPDLTATKEALIAKAVEIAKSIIRQAPIAVGLALEAVNRGLEMTLAEGQKVECDLFGISITTDDFTEGTNAFLEKRKAEFKGI
ncbi:enoyl-CoA hydratase/isomerase family protein [bacterium]|nr:enoyl-CoA hydratase/isomerase family protein [FCB group bacterium]MBL7190267.1 enoyl-CoA hydratase/isomerase family protein [bacterium]